MSARPNQLSPAPPRYRHGQFAGSVETACTRQDRGNCMSVTGANCHMGTGTRKASAKCMPQTFPHDDGFLPDAQAVSHADNICRSTSGDVPSVGPAAMWYGTAFDSARERRTLRKHTLIMAVRRRRMKANIAEQNLRPRANEAGTCSGMSGSQSSHGTTLCVGRVHKSSGAAADSRKCHLFFM